MSEITYRTSNKVASIHIDAAGRGNKFTPELRQELSQTLERFKADEQAWVGVISSAGSDFCLGSADTPPSSETDRRERFRLWAGGHFEIWKPLIVAIQGQCKGEGLALALACDLRVAAEDTTLQAGYMGSPDEPELVGPWLLHLVGLAKTFEILWTDSVVTINDALNLGLVNRVVLKGQPDAISPEGRLPMRPLQPITRVADGSVELGAMALAEELLLNGPVTQSFQKEVAYRSIGIPFHYAQSLEFSVDPLASQDRVEGTRAFVENRRPVWRRR